MNASLRTSVLRAIVFLLACASAKAQVRLDIERVALEANEEETIMVEVSDQANQIQGLRGAGLRINLDRMIFNQHGTQEGARKYFYEELRKWLDVTDAKLELTAEERAKLWLAGSSDIETFLTDADEISHRLANGLENEQLMQLRTLQVKMKTGVCSKDSMLNKVAKRMIAGERSAKAAKHAADRRKFAHASTVKLVIAEVEKTMPLTVKQRNRLVELLLKHVPGKLVDHRTFYNHALARLRDKAIEGMFERSEVRRFRVAISNAKNRGYVQKPAIIDIDFIN